MRCSFLVRVRISCACFNLHMHKKSAHTQEICTCTRNPHQRGAASNLDTGENSRVKVGPGYGMWDPIFSSLLTNVFDRNHSNAAYVNRPIRFILLNECEERSLLRLKTRNGVKARHFLQ
jgi:uncharacterized protein YlaI